MILSASVVSLLQTLSFGQAGASSGIHEAVRANDLQTVWSIAKKNPASLLEMEDGDFGYTPMHAAAEHGHLQMVALLSVLGTDVNMFDAATPWCWDWRVGDWWKNSSGNRLCT